MRAWDRDGDRAQRFVKPNKLIHVQKSPNCICRLNGENFQLLLVEHPTGTPLVGVLGLQYTPFPGLAQ